MGVQVTKKTEAAKTKAAASKATNIVEVYLAHGSKHRVGGVLFEKGIVYQVHEQVAEYLFGIVISNEQKFEQAGIKQKGLPRQVANVNTGTPNPNAIIVPDDDEVAAHVAKAHTGEANEDGQGAAGEDGQVEDGKDTEGAVSV